MPTWNDQARDSAAWAWGRRYYRWYATAHLLKATAPTLAALLATAATTAGMWALARHLGWPTTLRVVAATITTALLLRLTYHATTGAGLARHLTRHRNPLPLLGWLTATALVAASFLLR